MTDNKPTPDKPVPAKTAAVGTPLPADPVAKRVGADDTPERPSDAPERQEGVDANLSPYPHYEGEDVEALRKLANKRDVKINPEVEKALLIRALRDKDAEEGPDGTVGPVVDRANEGENPYPSYDFMPLDELRALADARDVHLKPVDEKAHLVTQLRASDSGAV